MGDAEITLAKIELPITPTDGGRVVDALLDLFSPLSEALGSLGDHVRLFRTRSILKTLSETKRLAEKAGVKLKTPPLKFLIPYLEEASKEDADDERFRLMWANLLLQVSTDQEKAHPLLVQILGRLTTRDAIALEKIVRNSRFIGRSVNQIVDAAFLFDKWDPVDRYVDDIIRSKAEPEAVQSLIERAEDRGTIVTSCGFYSIGPDGSEEDIFDDHIDFPESDELSLHALAALGLVRYPVSIVRQHRGGTFIMTLCVLTELGAEFYLMTHSQELRTAGSTISPFLAEAA